MIPQGFIEVNGIVPNVVGTVSMTINAGHVAVVHDAPAVSSCKMLVGGEWFTVYHSRSDVLAMIAGAWADVTESDVSPENVHDAYRQGLEDGRTGDVAPQPQPDPNPSSDPSPMSEPANAMVIIGGHAGDTYIHAALDHERGCIFPWQRAHTGLWDMLREIWDMGHETGIAQADAVMPAGESPEAAWSRGWRACAIALQAQALHAAYTENVPGYADPMAECHEGPTESNPAQ